MKFRENTVSFQKKIHADQLLVIIMQGTVNIYAMYSECMIYTVYSECMIYTVYSECMIITIYNV